MPADQRLGADDGIGLRVYLGLVVELELVEFESFAQFRFHQQPVGSCPVHRFRIVLVAVLATFLGVIHRGIRILDHVVDAIRVVRKHRDADARTDVEFVAIDDERFLE